MMQDGNFAVWENDEYRYVRNLDGTFTLLSNDDKSLDRGFVKDDFGRFAKTVPRNELQTAFNITNYCFYMGHEFQIIQSSTSQFLLSSDEPKLAEKLSFTFVDKGQYEKWVESSDVSNVREQRTSLYQFD